MYLWVSDNTSSGNDKLLKGLASRVWSTALIARVRKLPSFVRSCGQHAPLSRAWYCRCVAGLLVCARKDLAFSSPLLIQPPLLVLPLSRALYWARFNATLLFHRNRLISAVWAMFLLVVGVGHNHRFLWTVGCFISDWYSVFVLFYNLKQLNLTVLSGFVFFP